MGQKLTLWKAKTWNGMVRFVEAYDRSEAARLTGIPSYALIQGKVVPDEQLKRRMYEAAGMLRTLKQTRNTRRKRKKK